LVKLTLDLHDIYNSGPEIEKALKQKFDEAVAKKAPLLEIIPGKGSGQLKKHVLRFLDNKRSSVKNMRVEKPSKNFGTIKVHFNWNESGRR
jgi:dsDNA-specific endonuclease/ATPase MutS2